MNMQKIISIIKDFLYSAFIAILPTMLSMFVSDVIYADKEPSIGYGWSLLIVFSIATVIIFILRRQNSKKLYNTVGLIFLLGLVFMIVFIHTKGRGICKKVGGTYVTLGVLEDAKDINGDHHSGDSYGLEKVCYISKEKLEKIDSNDYSYRYVDFVIKN